jgi:hypothetical protein
MVIRPSNAKPLALPALTLWLVERGLNPTDAARELHVSPYTIRRYCLPFGDPERRIPRPEIIERITVWTAGAITANDFYPQPDLGPKTEEAACG